VVRVEAIYIGLTTASAWIQSFPVNDPLTANFTNSHNYSKKSGTSERGLGSIGPGSPPEGPTGTGSLFKTQAHRFRFTFCIDKTQAVRYCRAVNQKQISKIAAALGKLGGSAKSKAKAAAARKNGKLGGRPRKKR
jgi:hypothetical protein